MARKNKIKFKPKIVITQKPTFITIATKEHGRLIAEDMREEDCQEVLASHGFTPEKVCDYALENSQYKWAGYIKGELVSIFGVRVQNTTEGEIAIPWVLTCNSVKKYSYQFYKISVSVVHEWQKNFRFMVNMVDARYTTALKWVKKLGFRVYPPQVFGKNGELFHRIEMRRDN